MFEKFIITNHVIERYYERVSGDRKEILRRINNDLHFSKVKRIINIGSYRYVFTRNSKEFIFIKDNGKWILNTVIKRSRKSTDKAIEDRLKLAI